MKAVATTYDVLAMAVAVATAAMSSALAPVPARVSDSVTPKAEPFPLQSVRLLDGPFKQAM